jgi:hypothetical protein
MGVLQQEIVTIGPTGDYPSISAANAARTAAQKNLSTLQTQLVYEIEAGANGLGTSPTTAKFVYADGWRTNGAQGFVIVIRPAEGNKYLGRGTPDLSLSHLKIDNSGAADIDQAAVYADVAVQIENLQIVTTTDSATRGAVNFVYDDPQPDYCRLQSCLVHVTYTASPTGDVANAAGVYLNDCRQSAVHGCIIYVDFAGFCGGTVLRFENITEKEFAYSWIFNCTIVSDNATGSVSGTLVQDTWRFANCYVGHINSSAAPTAFDSSSLTFMDVSYSQTSPSVGSCASDDLTSTNVTNLPADATTFVSVNKATLDLTPTETSGLRNAGLDVSQIVSYFGQDWVPNVQDVRTVGQPVDKVYDIGAVEYTATPPVSPTPAPPAGPIVPADVLYRQRVSPRGRAVRVVEPLRNDERTHNPQLDLTYDASNRLQRLQKTLQNGDRIYVDLTYDAAGNLSSVTRWQELVVP